MLRFPEGDGRTLNLTIQKCLVSCGYGGYTALSHSHILTPTSPRHVGLDANALKHVGFGINDLIHFGFDTNLLKHVGLRTNDLRLFGFSTKLLEITSTKIVTSRKCVSACTNIRGVPWNMYKV